MKALIFALIVCFAAPCITDAASCKCKSKTTCHAKSKCVKGRCR